MNRITIDNITVEGEMPAKALRHAAYKAKLLADTAPPWEGEEEGEGKPQPSPAPEIPTLEQTRAWALNRIQREADQRLEQMFYPANHLWVPILECLHWLDNPEPQKEMYPSIYGTEALARGETPEQVVARWLREYQKLCRQHDHIRTLLYAYTELIRQAPSVEHILEYLADLDWNMPAVDADLLPSSPVDGRGEGGEG